ncbi:MAG TPA: precorrin-2 C(20)-methyltransferase [Actinomycetales bacterium]|nr:precorrin-2 C(20)-methyltransferase [Actinomycetales bacterium]
MSSTAGRLWGVGLGPGDPELVTVKAARLIAAADVIAFHSGTHRRSIARQIAQPYLRPGVLEEPLVYPVTTGSTDHPGGYEAAIADFYDDVACRLAAHLDAGRDVVVLCEGDPMFYGSYMYTHERLSARYRTEVVPGVTSVSAAAAALGRPLVQRDEVLTIMPGTLPREELARRLAATDAAAVLKLGRTFERVRGAMEDAGRGAHAWYVERASTERERTGPLRAVDPHEVPYFSLAMVPSPWSVGKMDGSDAERSSAPAPEAGADVGTPGEVVVVGLGPGDERWLTPEAREALESADHLVGYRTYLDRVPQRPGQQRHPSGNTVEAERADVALDLARGGACVAVVSSGDPGVFAMAAAVVEQAAADPRWASVPVRVLPGVTAAQAVASRVGAPLGHDFAVVSLSDRLKPWDVITARLDALARADLAIALYNPTSQSRTWQLGEARDVLLRHRDPATPVVIGRDVGGPQESVRVVTLADLDPAQVDMRCLLIVGSSQTRAVERDGRTTVLTPRRYPAASDA